jgi:hypothetical protein
MSARLMRSMLLTVLLALGVPVTAEVMWPDTEYDASIPTVESVLGYTSGERITWSHDVRRYFEALKAAAPEQVMIEDMATTWEGRTLFYAAISSAENMARVADVQAGMHQLLDPDTSSGEASGLIDDLPAVTWLAYGVHGNEISSSDAAMMTAYHLLAARGEQRVDDILAHSIVVLVPMQNPDGRDRFIHRFETALGLEPSSDRLSAEHNEPWPAGRTNHYLFDLNRDWFIRTQPETRGHADAVREWLPVAFVDLHEMGSDSTYYFAPEAVPFNPHLAGDQRASLQLFGRNNARWFDQFGIDYFTREVYDAFYPGYGASWPSYFGSVAMTYEQASSRGLVVRQYDGVEVPYEQTVRNHFLTSLATAETVATNREKLLQDFRDYQLSAVAEGKKENVKAFVIPAQADQDGVDRLGALLAAQGARVERANGDFKACGRQFGAGSLVINLDQPAKRMLRTLLDRDVPMDPDFVAEQERLHAKNLPDEMYDVTAWSMPMLFNLDSVSCERRVETSTTLVAADVMPKAAAPAKAAVAYVVPWGEQNAVRLLAMALRDGVAVKSSDRAFTLAGVEYPAGTLIIDVADNADDLHDSMTRYVSETRADVVSVSDSWVTEGPSFGSERVVRMNAPRIALAWDEPTSSYSAGNFRFVVERQFGYPVTPIRVADLDGADLSRYQVLVLPDTWRGYAGALSVGGIETLKDWVRRGGVVVALGGATRTLAHPDVDLLPVSREYRITDDEDAEPAKDEREARVAGKALDAEGYASAIAMENADPAPIGGAMLRAAVDPDHWLGAGVAETLHVLSRSADAYTPLKLDEGVNVARYLGADELVASGHIWEKTRRQLAWKPFVMAAEYGRGQVIGFTQDPTVRAYQDGLHVLVANALFRSAAHARPVR